MTSNITRIPLAIAMTSVLAFAVGCSNDRTADDRAMQPNDPAVTAPPVATNTTPANDMGRTDPMMDGPDSEQPGTDTWITTKVKADLLATENVSGLDIKVETVDGVVTLMGAVTSQAQKDKAVEVARQIKGVKRVEASGLKLASK